MPDRPSTVTFRFAEASDYRLLPVNALWGGRTPRGDIFVHLCHEHQALPETLTHALNSAGALGKELTREPKSVFDRTLLAGMVLSADQAESIGQWLLERADETRRRAAAKNRKAAKQKGDGHGTPETAH